VQGRRGVIYAVSLRNMVSECEPFQRPVNASRAKVRGGAEGIKRQKVGGRAMAFCAVSRRSRGTRGVL
jgi:hypothetical protein